MHPFSIAKGLSIFLRGVYFFYVANNPSLFLTYVFVLTEKEHVGRVLLLRDDCISFFSWRDYGISPQGHERLENSLSDNIPPTLDTGRNSLGSWISKNPLGPGVPSLGISQYGSSFLPSVHCFSKLVSVSGPVHHMATNRSPTAPSCRNCIVTADGLRHMLPCRGCSRVPQMRITWLEGREKPFYGRPPRRFIVPLELSLFVLSIRPRLFSWVHRRIRIPSIF